MTLRLVIVTALWLAAVPAWAQILSPGRLSRPHAGLEGLANCTRCHELGEKVSGKLCLDCHAPLARLIAAGRGLHAGAEVRDRSCVSCHREHRGREAALAEWGAPRERFDHRRAGWRLDGKHAGAGCESCHRADLVADAELGRRLERRANSTWLGLERACTVCHFDEHRGQLGFRCDRCHDASGWRLTSFEHASYPLRGAHARAACERCHAREVDTARHDAGTPAPRDPAGFTRFRPVRSAACTDCHRDVHAGKLGRGCERCHGQESWTAMARPLVDTRFHDRTRFPLKGRHRNATCASCHPSRPRGGMQTRGLRFERCTDCHVDAHLGQLGDAEAGRCDRCHDEDGFYPPRYALAAHQVSRYPLEGAHRAVPCNACHRLDETGLLPLAPASARRGDGKLARTEIVNLTRLRMAELQLDRCDACHADPHAGQLQPRPCADCHSVDSFASARLDHDLDTRFPLAGKHRGVACARCHPPAAASRAARYRGVPMQCAGCHRDPHLGQFTGNDEATDCARCHDPLGFTPSRFSHADGRHTAFALTGRHAELACSRCHPEVRLPESEAVWYRGVPARCDGCHEDVHAAGSTATGGLAPAARSNKAGGFAPASPASWAGEPAADCDACHTTAGWERVDFDHGRTRLPLEGRHAGLPCRACHQDLRRVAVDPRCGSCHEDPHAGRLGPMCERCHDTTFFDEGAGVLAHGATRFPLYGRHALVPCDECHLSRGDRTLGGVPPRCETCHERDLLRTAAGGVDHLAAGLRTDCQRCHNSVSFRGGGMPEHDRCFPLSRGDHRGLGCLDCHTSPPGLRIGACNSFSAGCSRCHRCAEMDREHREEGVAGYQCADRKCYECHPSGRGD